MKLGRSNGGGDRRGAGKQGMGDIMYEILNQKQFWVLKRTSSYKDTYIHTL